MKPMFCTLAALCALLTITPAGRAADPHETRDAPSAYTALRLVGKTLGADAINHVLEVRGRDGVPQPLTWTIVLQDGEGSKEIDVADGKIEAQRPSAKPAAGAPIKLQDLNLDSSGAFEATDAQARKTHVRFDSINYVLRTGEKTGKPFWTLELFNQAGASAGTMKIAASDGAILSSSGLVAAEASPTPAKVVVESKPSPKPAATPKVAPTPKPAVVAVVEKPSPTPKKEIKPAPVTTTTTTTTLTVQNNPPVVDVPDANGGEPAPVPADDGGGGFFTRAGRTLDHTSHNVGHSLDRANHDVNDSLRRAGAKVQRFFTGHSDLDKDAQPAPAPVEEPD